MALPCSAIGGLCLALSYPGTAWWPLALLGTLLVVVGTLGRAFWSAFLQGAVSGGVYWALLIRWLDLYLGPVPWVALAAVMACYFALGLGVVSWLTRPWLRASHVVMPVFAIPLVFGLVWTARETLSGMWPYGGFPWGRLALSQSNSPLAETVSWIGISGLSFLLASVCALPVSVIWWKKTRPDRHMPHPRSIAVAGASALLTLLLAAVVPAWGSLASWSGTIRVAAVQGNANAGLFAEHYAGDWLSNHLTEAETIDPDDYDIMVWPENASDVDPLEDASAARSLEQFVDSTGKPLVFGAITQRGGLYYNTSLLWEPNHSSPSALYDKRHPVPFAEYMPDRAFFSALAPDLVSLVTRDYTAGTSNGVFTAAGHSFGVNICFDIAFDDVLRDAVEGGAEFIVAQTNNADFGYSDESAQQLAIAHMQALATGRSVVSISTVGYSAVFTPDGEVSSALARYTAGSMIVTIPTISAISPGTVIGGGMSIASMCGAALVLLSAGARRTILCILRRKVTR